MAILKIHNSLKETDPVVFKLLNDYFDSMIELIRHEHGIIDYEVHGRGVPDDNTLITVTFKRDELTGIEPFIYDITW